MGHRWLVALSLLLGACQGPATGGGTGLLGRAQPSTPPTVQALADLDRAQADWAALQSEEHAIWVGRRLGYLGRYEEAIAWYSEALLRWPDSYRLRRHRGHRLISLRRFGEAEHDFAQAWDLARAFPNELEPDGSPNELGVPVSSDHGNILYHLALSRYLQGNFGGAAEAFGEGLLRALSVDSEVSCRYWLSHCLRAEQRFGEALAVLEGVRADEAILENHSYHALCLALSGRMTREECLARAENEVDRATIGYGLAAFSLHQEPSSKGARAALALVAERGPWSAFGTIAAEAELARLGYVR